jgi:hypothetical protein
MDPLLTWQAVEAMVAERHRKGESMAASRARQGSPRREVTLDATAVTVRFATPGDARELERLAELDSGSVPDGAALVAEVGGQLLAALPLGPGRALADPLRPTAGLVRLLELRESQKLRGRSRSRRGVLVFNRPGKRARKHRRSRSREAT